MHEEQLLHHIRTVVAAARVPGVVVGPGDDCAVVACASPMLLTVDQVVAGRHVDLETTPLALVARKAIARSVSDIAAMGGAPRYALATGCLSPGFTGGEELVDALHAQGRELGSPVVGGDLAMADGPLVLTVTVVGVPHAGRGPVLRSGAVSGMGVYVTGLLGGALRSGHHLRFTPRVAEGAALCDRLGDALGAMIDLSDGAGRDASRLAAASGVAIELDASSLPRRDEWTDWREAAGDGEDYELLFAAADRPMRGVSSIAGTPVTRIGEVRDGAGCTIRTPEGTLVDATELGWEHSG